MSRRSVAALLTAGAAVALTGCTSTAPPAPPAGGASTAAGGPITVQAADTACEVSIAEAPAGTITFNVTNGGDKVTEFYLYGEDGLRIVGEVENVGPGLSRDLVINVPAGEYIPACKPGMVGKGIRSAFTVPTRNDYLFFNRAGRSQPFRQELRKDSLRLLLFWEEWLLAGGRYSEAPTDT